MIKRWLAVGIILLFIGVAFGPSINFSVVKASNDNELIEVTTEACGIKGFGNTTVKLTRQQYQDLEQYLVFFRAKLNQTTTQEKAIPIFKKAVVELNKYGLLPKGMSVEQAQRLVIHDTHEHIFQSWGPFEKLNFFALIAGHLNNSFFHPLFSDFIMTGIGAFFIFLFCFIHKFFPEYTNNFIIFFILVMNFYQLIIDFYNQYIPFSLYCLVRPESGNFSGWVTSVGILGFRLWSGDLMGEIDGFTGIKLKLNDCSDHFFIGRTTFVRMEKPY
jgi:hypothetical protein